MAQRVKVHKHLVAKILTNYYWLLVSVSLLLFLYSAPRMPPFIKLSFYPLYFLVGYLVKYFLQTRIPSIFSELHQTGALREEALPSLVEDLQRRLNSRLGDLLGIVGGLVDRLVLLQPHEPPDWPCGLSRINPGCGY
jgi:hypothetical protein